MRKKVQKKGELDKAVIIGIAVAVVLIIAVGLFFFGKGIFTKEEIVVPPNETKKSTFVPAPPLPPPISPGTNPGSAAAPPLPSSTPQDNSDTNMTVVAPPLPPPIAPQ